MKVAVAGGTGVVGRFTTEALRGNGDEPIVLSRSKGVDLITGKGLDEALAGVDAVIDVTNVNAIRAKPSTAFFTAASRALTGAAQRAGVRHIVTLSIIGIDQVPMGYYQGKLRQEEVLRDSPVPASILRAAQFHEFPVQYLARSKGPVLVVPKFRTQPVAAREVAGALARLAAGTPVPMSQLAGPREEVLADMVRQVLRARAADGRGGRRGLFGQRVIEVRVPGAMGRAFANGAALPGAAAARGTQTFAEWLAEQRAAGTL
jgi:uncharacterized protein YbjT (DUF2867 family)